MTIDGRKIAQKILDEIREKVEALQQAQGKKLRLAAVLISSDEELKKFLELKRKAAEEVGIEFRQYDFPGNVTDNELLDELDKICKEKTTQGVILELPLPKRLNTQYLLNTIPEEKDVDVLSEESQEKFFSGKSKILPPAVEAVKQIFDEYDIDPRGKTAAVFGQGLLVGKTVSHWLARQGANVSVVTEDTKEPEKVSRKADIIVSGVGHPNLITEEMVKEGAVLIDFGRDVDFESVSKKASLITPPTGGVGPIVVAAVLKNLVDLWTQ